MTIGIVAGMAEELAAFAPDAPSKVHRHGRLDVRRTRVAGRDVALCSGGVGKVAAAAAATLLSARHDATLLIVVGTAAALHAAPGHAYRITEAIQSDYGARRADRFARYTAGTIPLGRERLTPFVARDVPGCDLPTARIASADMFVESPAHAAEIGAALACQLIDMETAAVAQAATLLGIAWLAIKATTDAADEASAASFRAALAAAATQAAEAAERLIPLL